MSTLIAPPPVAQTLLTPPWPIACAWWRSGPTASAGRARRATAGAHGGAPAPPRADPRTHPDDECITGAPAAAPASGSRLARDRAGRDPGQRPPPARPRAGPRCKRLCAVLGFEPRCLADQALAAVMSELHPDLVLLPHAQDDNPTHRRVHAAGIAALADAQIDTVLACTEFWSTQAAPNALVADQPGRHRAPDGQP